MANSPSKPHRRPYWEYDDEKPVKIPISMAPPHLQPELREAAARKKAGPAKTAVDPAKHGLTEAQIREHSGGNTHRPAAPAPKPKPVVTRNAGPSPSAPRHMAQEVKPAAKPAAPTPKPAVAPAAHVPAAKTPTPVEMHGLAKHPHTGKLGLHFTVGGKRGISSPVTSIMHLGEKNGKTRVRVTTQSGSVYEGHMHTAHAEQMVKQHKAAGQLQKSASDGPQAPKPHEPAHTTDLRVVPNGLKRELQPVLRNPKTGVVLGGIKKVVRHAAQHPEHQNLAHHEVLTDTGSKHVWADKHAMKRLAEKGGITYELGLKKGEESSMPEELETVEVVTPEEQAADIERALNATDGQRLLDAVHKSIAQRIARGILARLPQPEPQPEAPTEAA